MKFSILKCSLLHLPQSAWNCDDLMLDSSAGTLFTAKLFLFLHKHRRDVGDKKHSNCLKMALGCLAKLYARQLQRNKSYLKSGMSWWKLWPHSRLVRQRRVKAVIWQLGVSRGRLPVQWLQDLWRRICVPFNKNIHCPVKCGTSSNLACLNHGDERQTAWTSRDCSAIM